MKLLTLFIIQFFCFASLAGPTDCFPVGKEGAKTSYADCDLCAQAEGQECFKKNGESPEWLEVQITQVDDLEKPIYKAPYNSINCDSEMDCTTKFDDGSLNCDPGDLKQFQKNAVLPGYTAFCTGITGYEQKAVTQAVVNQALKDSIQAAKAAADATEAAIEAREKNIGFGVRMIAYVGVRNDAKNLTTEQSAQFIADYQAVMFSWQAGAIETSRAQIAALTPDGVITTQADKDAILAELDAYLASL